MPKCYWCGQESTKSFCPRHMLRIQQYQRKMRARRKADGLCVYCGDQALEGMTRCAPCQGKDRVAGERSRWRVLLARD